MPVTFDVIPEMKPTKETLKELLKDNRLVAVQREGIDAQKIQGFILDYSEDLILLLYVYDFHLDGLLLIRISDVSDIDARLTDDFQKKLLLEEGKLDPEIFRTVHPIGSYEAFLKSLPKGRIVILEDEESEETEFLIGIIKKIESGNVSVRYFTGAGNWESDPRSIALNNLTSVQTLTHYTEFYARHFEREGTLES